LPKGGPFRKNGYIRWAGNKRRVRFRKGTTKRGKELNQERVVPKTTNRGLFPPSKGKEEMEAPGRAGMLTGDRCATELESDAKEEDQADQESLTFKAKEKNHKNYFTLNQRKKSPGVGCRWERRRPLGKKGSPHVLERGEVIRSCAGRKNGFPPSKKAVLVRGGIPQG